ncbi:MAG: aminodeoxychorismate synthase component I [Bacteroidales bacterium]|nr:aminodeoxychorismate synthase component I [Bacteroidales bacterium]
MNNKCEISKKITDFAVKGQKFVFAINFNGDDGFVLTPEAAAQQGIYFDIEGTTNFKYFEGQTSFNRFDILPVPFSDYEKAFDKVQYYIGRGDTFLINLTFKTEIITDIKLIEIFNYSKAKYKLLYKDKFVVFSPESFVKTEGNILKSFPMKGTIDAKITNAEAVIMESLKEYGEHTTIVDLIRNDLNIIGANTQVEKFRYIDKIISNRGELLQVSSIISTELPENYYENVGEMFFKLLPAGSITGAPKEKTVKIIKEVETYERGYYTGVFGYFDGENFNTAVSIRFIEKESDKMFYKSGGGITAMSDAKSEYEELIQKIYVPFL